MRLAVTCALLLACGTDGAPALFPDNYAATYQEVRSCRMSLEHSANVRILASPDAFEAYSGRKSAFPVGSIVLKEEYAQSDASCAKGILHYTVMQKLATDSAPATLDWEWEKDGADKRQVQTDIPTCVNCHSVCGKPPQGYD